MRVRACAIPDDSLLAAHAGAGGYADAYTLDVARRVTQAEFIEAFTTTWLFRLERRLLGWFVARPSSDVEAGELARGTRARFAAWEVEARTPDQLLLRDFTGRTRSWLQAVPLDPATTRLVFGSAVVPIVDPRSGERRLGVAFRALLGFHRLYSRALLRATATRLLRDPMR